MGFWVAMDLMRNGEGEAELCALREEDRNGTTPLLEQSALAAIFSLISEPENLVWELELGLKSE